jgi:PadR family transcriptional regulator
MRKTHALVQVAIALLDDPASRYWGYALSQRSGVRSGVLYPMLTRMLDEGWLTDGWEDPTTIRDKRPPRRYYELTSKAGRSSGQCSSRPGTMPGSPTCAGGWRDDRCCTPSPPGRVCSWSFSYSGSPRDSACV